MTAPAELAAGPSGANVRAFNPWIVALAVIIPTFMEVLDTTIANVALRYMAGGLSAPSSDSEWVITSYLLLIRLFQQATKGSVGDGAPVISEDSGRIPGEVRERRGLPRVFGLLPLAGGLRVSAVREPARL